MRHPTRLLLLLLTGLLALTVPRAGVAQQKTMAPSEFVAWLPVTDAERALKSPSVEKDAGAEILIWRVHVVDELLGSRRDLQRVVYNYIRVKVFNEKGKEDTSTIDLTYREPGGIEDVAGRVIKPDGTVLDLDRKSIYRRDLVRAGRARAKAVSFAMPGVEPGAILEYRWRQIEDDNRFKYIRLNFQRDFPVQRVTYFVKPLPYDITGGQQMFLLPINCRPTPIQPENDGYNSTTLTDVPAAHHEPYAPSDPNLEPWALLFYTEGGNREPEKYWSGQGKKLYAEMKTSVKESGELKSAADEAVSGAADDEGKVTALVTLVRKRVRNLFDSSVTAAEREKFIQKLPNDRARTSAEIFKSGIGTFSEMNVVFAALAQQAGFETRPALVGNRNEVVFNPQLADRYFLDDEAMAVKLGGTWKIVDVGRKSLTPGMLPWEEESMFALLADPKAPTFIKAPAAPPEASMDKRTARLQLSSEGTLSGDVDEAYTGHKAEQIREEIGEKSPAQREEWVHNEVVRMFPDAQVTAIQLENVDDASKSLTAHYHLDAPRYAQVTGKRIFFQPSPFRRGQGSPFSAADRRFAIAFPFAWKEIDEVHIRLPQGFSLDNADSPGSLDFGDPGSYKLVMQVAQGAAPEFQLSREFTFGNRAMLYFEPKTYPTLKRVFDTIQSRDAHAISLKGN